VSTTEQHARTDVSAALVALGYGDKEVNAVMKNFPNELNVNEGIRWALQQLSK
jgi:Holliday junction DNA helicase RuvA